MKPTAFVYVVPPRMKDAAEHNSQLLEQFESRSAELLRSLQQYTACRGPASRGRMSDIHEIGPELAEASDKYHEHLVSLLNDVSCLVVDLTFFGDQTSVALLEAANMMAIPIITTRKHGTDFPSPLIHYLPRGFHIHYGTEQQLVESLGCVFHSPLLQSNLDEDTQPAIPSKIG